MKLVIIPILIMAGIQCASAASGDKVPTAPATTKSAPDKPKKAPGQNQTHWVNPSEVVPIKDPKQTFINPSKVPPSSPPSAQVPRGSRNRKGLPNRTVPPSTLKAAEFQTPDHLLENMDSEKRGSLVDQIRYVDSVNNLFENFENIHPDELTGIGNASDLQDVLGMDGAEVDTGALAGEGNNTLEQLEEAFGAANNSIESAFDMPESTTPRNPLKNGTQGLGGAPTGPSDPRGAMGGADGLHKINVPKHATTTHLPVGDGSTETFFSRWEDWDGEEHGQLDEFFEDGTSRTRRWGEEGAGASQTTYDAEGEAAAGRGVLPRASVDQTQDPDNTDPDGAWARWHAKHLGGQRPDLSLKNPNRVGSGEEGADTGPAKGQINPGAGIVVNPDIFAEGGQAREVNAEQAAHWQQQLKEKAGGLVNPPGGVDDALEE